MHKVVDYINEYLSFPEEYYQIFGKHVSTTSKCFCCFHPNDNTPAAKMYGNYMYCFVCKRKYGVYDLLKAYNPERINDVKSSIVLPGSSTSTKAPKAPLPSIDRTQPIESILKTIFNDCPV